MGVPATRVPTFATGVSSSPLPVWSSIAMLKLYVIEQIRNEAAERVGAYLYSNQTGTA